MENFDIYKNIAERTDGDIYIGVVGPVRTGKSSFIKKFMELSVIPNIDNAYKKERAKDELPQSGSGKEIHTTEPKFIPNEAVSISLDEGTKFKVRMVDCVGYIVKSASGYINGDTPKFVMTPWYDYEIPFEEAAEIGTKKVITDHSTIGIVITTDGSVAGIDRNDYVAAEERVISELKSINKPFLIVLNSAHVDDSKTVELKDELEKKYKVPVQLMDVLNMRNEDILNVFDNVLREFPVTEINIDVPSWVEKLGGDHWLKIDYINSIKDIAESASKIRDIKKQISEVNKLEFVGNAEVRELNMGDGKAEIIINPKSGIFYDVLSESAGTQIKDESDLLRTIEDFKFAKVEYDKIESALKDVRETGYGLVSPELNEMTLEEPEIVRHGNRYGVKLKASAPSLHLIKADIQTEISPIMGSEKETEMLVKSILEQFESDPSKIWQSDMFGKNLEILVKEGLQNKLFRMPEKVQVKIQSTLQKIINEGDGSLICIIL